MLLITLMYNDSRYYRTSNFYLAAFLFAKGIEIAGVDRPVNSKKAMFVLVDHPRREELLRDFNFATENSGEVTVDARKLIYAIKTLKEKLYQD